MDREGMRNDPNWRMPAGIFIILGLIAALGVCLASFANAIASLHWAAQLPVYLIAGIVWIAPLKPLLRWMETGRWW